MATNNDGTAQIEIFAVDLDPESGLPVALLCPTALDPRSVNALSRRRQLPLQVPLGQGEATIITALLRGVVLELPPMHQVMGWLLESVGAHLDHIQLTSEDGVRWRARLHFALPDGQTNTQMVRGADGLALALSQQVAIRVATDELQRFAETMAPVPIATLAAGSIANATAALQPDNHPDDGDGDPDGDGHGVQLLEQLQLAPRRRRSRSSERRSTGALARPLRVMSHWSRTATSLTSFSSRRDEREPSIPVTDEPFLKWKM